jgi:hypothetical protein
MDFVFFALVWVDNKIVISDMASNIYGNGSMKLPVSRAEPKIRALIDRERERGSDVPWWEEKIVIFVKRGEEDH